MEMTLLNPQARINHRTLTKPPHSIHIPEKKASTHKKPVNPNPNFPSNPPIQVPRYPSTNHKKPLNLTTNFPSNSPIQIELPLHRPQYKPHHTLKQIPSKTSEDSSTTSTTTSDILRLMDSLKIPLTLDLYVSLIKECTKNGDPLQATELYKHIRGSRLFPTLPLLNLLLLMYVCCGCLDNARELFDKIRVRNACSWAVMIASYFSDGDYGKVLDLFVQMRCCDQARGEFDDATKLSVSGILVCVFKACIQMMNLEFGEQVHGWILKTGFSRSVVLSSSLMRFYGKFGSFKRSDCVFNQIPNCNTVSWTARIVNCCDEEQFHKAIYVFREIGKVGVKKNGFTFSSVLKACGKITDGGFCGRQVHASAIKLGLELDEYVHCALVDMYGKNGLMGDAERVFKISVDSRGAARWNALVTGYIQQGLCVEAIKILYEMKAAGLQPQESLLYELRFICGSNVRGG